jgi:hypothetical protein
MFDVETLEVGRRREFVEALAERVDLMNYRLNAIQSGDSEPIGVLLVLYRANPYVGPHHAEGPNTLYAIWVYRFLYVRQVS